MTLRSNLLGVVAAGLLVSLTACQDDSGLLAISKDQRPLNLEMTRLMESKSMAKDSPILIRIFKDDSKLEVWKQDKTGRYALLKDYKICAWGGKMGPKITQGDYQSPEGFYSVKPSQMNPKSQFYLSFDVGFPNAFDKALGRTGGDIMVHGDCSSAGCFAMTDGQVEEIYALAREAFAGGQRSFQVQSFPFHMTAKNMAKYRNSPHFAFWKNIKEGYDHFEVTRLEPKVDVCDKRYVFDAEITDKVATGFSPAAACPAYSVNADVALAMQARAVEDNKDYQVAVAAFDAEAKARADADAKKAAAELETKMAAAKPKASFSLFSSGSETDAKPVVAKAGSAGQPAGAAGGGSWWSKLSPF